jgi:hypothetical protein
MDETGEAPLPTGPVSNLKGFTLEVPPPALPEFNPTVPSEQARCPSPTSSSPEPEQQPDRTGLPQVPLPARPAVVEEGTD